MVLRSHKRPHNIAVNNHPGSGLINTQNHRVVTSTTRALLNTQKQGARERWLDFKLHLQNIRKLELLLAVEEKLAGKELAKALIFSFLQPPIDTTGQK